MTILLSLESNALANASLQIAFALGNDLRWHLIRILSVEGSLTMSELSRRVDMSRQATLYALEVLYDAYVVNRDEDKRYSINEKIVMKEG